MTTTTTTPAQPAVKTGHPVKLSATRIDPKDFAPMLADLQGDILKPNGRNFARHIVFCFTGTPDKVKSWLKNLAVSYVTTAAKQIEQTNEFRRAKADGGIFGTLGLTAQAYYYLGFELQQIPRDRMAHYHDGMISSSTQAILNDPPTQSLEPWSQETIHAVLNLFDNTEDKLDSAVKEITAGADDIATVLTVQKALRLRDAANQVIEPFGYRDGISQPLFYAEDIPSNPGEYDPSAPLSLVLIQDPNGEYQYSCGSFFVYRKLKQDTAGFAKNVAELAKKLNTTEELAGAYVVGRFQDGTPVMNSNAPKNEQPADNAFQYADDAEAAKCPFHSHIRKANPRGDTVRSNGAPLDVERSHRIVRRAFVFKDDDGSEGLQFFCYQSDIFNQFEFIQASWSNQAHFSRMDSGLDGVIGQAAPNDGTRPPLVPTPQPWPNTWGDAQAKTTTFDFGRWVSLRGGEYFFAPSLSFFTSLSS